MSRKQRRVLIRIIVSAALVALVSWIPIPTVHKTAAAGSLEADWAEVIRLALFMIPYLVIGYDVLRKAWKGIMNRQVFDENFLMAVATVGAIALRDYKEGVAVMLFYQVGELFQSYAVDRSRKNISDLMDIRPDYAQVESADGTLTKTAPDEVEVGTVILVRPGEKIPIDGEVTEGTASLDTSALTGESMPREVKAGDQVISGCINMNGLLRIRTTKEFGESTVSRILDLVENASSKKSRSEQFISKFARYYTPAVCYAALALAVLPPLGRLLFLKQPAQAGVWVYRALTFLVISCPCALVISIPLSFFAGIGAAGKAGVLIKGSNYMETLARTRTVVFDKTGTVTKGVFEVNGVHHNAMDEQELLRYAAYAESYSSHPISLSIRRAYGQEIDGTVVTDVEEIVGQGVMARVDGVAVAAGNKKLMQEIGVTPADCSGAGTVVHVAVDGVYGGHILISDQIKPGAAGAIRELKRMGVNRIVMLTGDLREAAERTAELLGIHEVQSELLPADKVALVEKLLEDQPPGSRLAFVGDGMNDAPVLSRADIGIAMGALGSDAAIEAADVVLMDDDPSKIAAAMGIAKRCIRIVYENIYFAVGVKVICLLLGAVGIANMWTAVFADVGVMVLAVLNAIRVLFTGRRDKGVVQ